MSVYRRALALILLVSLLIAGCGSAEPMATSVPVTATRITLGPTNTPRLPTATPVLPTETPVPPTNTPVPPTETATPIPTETATPQPTDTPAPLRPLSGSGGGVIAFSSERNGNLEIYVMNADGSDQRRLTKYTDMDVYPSWSPDGSKIAFHAHHGMEVWSIYTINADGSDRQRLTDGVNRDASPVWSPDGTQFVFSRDDDLWVMDADGSNQRQLTMDRVDECCADWSPDGTEIAFESNRDGNSEIYVMTVPEGTDAGGTDQRRLTFDEADDWWPNWSPDGSQIAFKSNRDGDFEIYVMNADGTDLHQLTDNRAQDGEPDWSPDGTQIAFHSTRDGNEEIYVMDADGTNVRRLTDNAARDITPAWRPLPPTTGSMRLPAQAVLGDTWTRPTDGMVMVYVPAGEFMMGNDADKDGRERPEHSVTLDGFWIDRTEVSNAQFDEFVADTGYETDAERKGWGWAVTRSGTDWSQVAGADWRHPEGSRSDIGERMDHPVVLITWDEAAAYCEWAGGRLPTEAEWEYAARGPEGHIYPWGDTFDGTLLNFCDANCPFSWRAGGYDDGYGRTAPVGSYPGGASWCGALNMAGNAHEWVADWYGGYPSEPQVNPTGPSSGRYKTLHGNGWFVTSSQISSTQRAGHEADDSGSASGFRCALDSK